jgi:A/G-specific adenine glycosylase
MEKWPSIEELARASPDEVKEVWSGLGYYSRAQRLLEAARKVMNVVMKPQPQFCSHFNTIRSALVV